MSRPLAAAFHSNGRASGHPHGSEGSEPSFRAKTKDVSHFTSVSDFIGVKELAALTGFAPKTIYFQHSTQHGALVPILSKLGRKLGAWRGDYETWRNKQRKLQPDS